MKATRPLEYVAFFAIEMRTGEGPAHLFLAVDAYLDFVFQLGVERDRSPETVLKNIYLLMENPDFAKHTGKGFTLVLEEFQELADKIQAIINHDGGKLLLNKGYNNEIANPVLISLLGSFKQKP